MVSFFTSQMISGPRNQPQPPTQPVTRPPSSADRCANMAHWRSSVLGVPAGGGVPADVGGVTDSGGTLIAYLPQSSDGRNGPCKDCPRDRRACQAAVSGRYDQATERAAATRPPSGSAAALPGNTRDSSTARALLGGGRMITLEADPKHAE